VNRDWRLVKRPYGRGCCLAVARSLIASLCCFDRANANGKPNRLKPVLLLRLPILSIEFQELHGRGFPEFEAEAGSDLPQGLVEMRKVVDGHVADKRAAHFIVAHTAMQPPQEEERLQARGKADDDPVGIHKSVV
jgi:hypothetical protein